LKNFDLPRGQGAVRALLGGLALMVAGCGGGGDGRYPFIETRAPLPQIVEDQNPVGARIDVSADDFFAVAAGDRARYQGWLESAGRLAYSRREVTQGPDAAGRYTVVETVEDQTAIEPTVERWQRRADGLVALDFYGDGAPPGFRAIVGDILVYPTPFYPAGSQRKLIRQGSLGVDLDEDGTTDTFRLEFQQVFVGFETGTRGGRAERRARFQNRLLITIQPSHVANRVITSEFTEEAVFAAHTGLIRSTGTVMIDGTRPPEFHSPGDVVSGTLAGRDVEQAWNGSTTRHVLLRHRDVLFEPVTGHYYAGLSMRDTQRPGTVARVHPVTGEVAYSIFLGGEVWSVAASADGTTLYASIPSTHEIVRLSLPDLQVVHRTALPGDSFGTGLAVSPVDAGTLAFNGWESSKVRLLRDGIVLPDGPKIEQVRADTDFGSMLFSLDGSRLLAFGTSGSGNGLLSIPVLPGGLGTQPQVAGYPGGRSLAHSSAGLVAGNGLYRTADLMLLRAVSDTRVHSCVPLVGVPRWACRASVVDSNRVAVVDAQNLALIDDGLVPFELPPSASHVIRVVAGPHGQVAVMVGGESAQYGDFLALVESPEFR
jgi:hypothetical protein